MGNIDKAKIFDEANPEVWAEIKKTVRRAKARGLEKWSIEGIVNLIRWERPDLKINNNYKKYYALKLDSMDEFKGLLTFRGGDGVTL